MTNITFEKLPEAVAQLHEKLSNIERLLKDQATAHTPEADEILTIKEASLFLGLSVPTIYDKVHKAEIPVSKRARRLFFSKNDLTAWLKAGRRKTNEELAREALAREAAKKKRGANA
ncbi:helix-turn-helix domain-containing protein [Cesiribacter andamanensis]|nr:helix-turn-helix domain-containing protein [Cesiribacter andamanensis]